MDMFESLENMQDLMVNDKYHMFSSFRTILADFHYESLARKSGLKLLGGDQHIPTWC